VQLLKSDCVFTSVNLSSRTTKYDKNSCSWFVARQIRMRELKMNTAKWIDTNAVNSWLGNSVRYVEKVTVLPQYRSNYESVPSVIHMLTNLREFFVSYCDTDDAFWEVIQRNPNLVTLSVKECNWSIMEKAPENLILPCLKRLSVLDGFLTPSVAESFLKQLPALA